jgi:hypothetical protein
MTDDNLPDSFYGLSFYCDSRKIVFIEKTFGSSLTSRHTAFKIRLQPPIK